MLLVVVMGVSGCGKSTMGAALAERLGVPFIEGDGLHPESNIAKMSAGIALTDEDRAPWLARIGEVLKAHAATGGAVVSCSALKKAYRDRLRNSAGVRLVFVYMEGSRALLESRMTTRPGHFMPASLLDSQLSVLEPPVGENDVLTVDCAEPVAPAAERTAAAIAALEAAP